MELLTMVLMILFVIILMNITKPTKSKQVPIAVLTPSTNDIYTNSPDKVSCSGATKGSTKGHSDCDATCNCASCQKNGKCSDPTCKCPMCKNKDKLTVEEENHLIKNRGDPIKVMPDFPYPKTSTNSVSLTPEKPEDLSIIQAGSTLDQPLFVIEERSNPQTLNETRFPQYYRKDSLKADPGNSEYRFAEVNNKLMSKSWSDLNVSQYPNFYNANIKDELSNVGNFFDVNNQFVDTTSPRSDAHVGDICYKGKDGQKVCLENTRHHMVPPSLIDNISNCGFLNDIGLLSYSNYMNNNEGKVQNGAPLYGQVKGSVGFVDEYSKPLAQESLTCTI